MEEKLGKEGKELEVTVDNTPSHNKEHSSGVAVNNQVVVEYEDPLTEDYKIERSNNIESKTFLVQEVWAKKDIEHNIRLH
ncbi:hypothetical protein HYY69_05670 [Candidatus Woesearchaeota archaeon]|nr:hypothetical protein [Candidatus Woesearchaeota archaeon]